MYLCVNNSKNYKKQIILPFSGLHYTKLTDWLSFKTRLTNDGSLIGEQLNGPLGE